MSPTSPNDPEPDAASAACPLCGSPAAQPPDPAREQLQKWLGPEMSRRLGLFPIPPGLRVSVVVAVYNEKPTLEELIRRVRAVSIPKEIIVVDDGSTDGTRELLDEMEGQPGLRIFHHHRNQGKGAALKTGFGHVTGDIVIVQDADLEYDPVHYPELIQPIVAGVADVVYGSRFVATGPHRVLYFWHSVANRVLTMLSNMFTDLNLTDMETCYKVFRREVIDQVAPTLKEKRFGIEAELTAKVARRKSYGEGKKIGVRDAFRALWCILRYWKLD